MNALSMLSPVGQLSGVGKTTEKQLTRLGIETVGDLIYHFPRAYERRGDVKPLSQVNLDGNNSFLLTVSTKVTTAKTRSGLTISEFLAKDDSGVILIKFFNSDFITRIFTVGATFRFYGKVKIGRGGRLEMTSPKYEAYFEGAELQDFVPVYHQTEGLSSKKIDKLVHGALSEVLPSFEDPIPEDLRLTLGLPTLTSAITTAHKPKGERALSKALERLAFDEMFIYAIGISMQKVHRDRGKGIPFSPCRLEPLSDLLPYSLTNSQKETMRDVYRDTVLGHNGVISSMARIVVGDVGCGKTVCAVFSMYLAAMSGYQSALMVPTEILARQHYKDTKELLSKLGIKVELILGSTTQKEKKRIYRELEAGETDVLIGTHAIISERVVFARLGLVITDEQHRFGVAQRALLKEKASSAHMLVMSATPIPRTLALAMYGDLDVSRITDMPKGRQRVDTFVVDESYRTRLNAFITKLVGEGGQCYIVCPSIEADDEAADTVVADIGGFYSTGAAGLKNAVDYAKELCDELPDLCIEVLHGKMKPSEKDEIMRRFSLGEIDVLVSTTVIEVGVNVPNASLMIVENAERFGLSQLHQLRGRVGRGERKSYCILVSDIKNERSRQRLEIMRTTYDGFEIAEKDLMLRGPGDFFSSNGGNNLRQSGGFEFRFASTCDSAELFDAAFNAAKDIIARDPELTLPEHSGLRSHVLQKLLINNSSVS